MRVLILAEVFDCKSEVCQSLSIAGLPLAVYLEIAAHLRQLEGVDAELIAHNYQTQPVFSYQASQVAGISLKHKSDLKPETQTRLEAILAYYQNIYGVWQRQKD